jgi:3-methyladenine DNA glycosylase AlkD
MRQSKSRQDCTGVFAGLATNALIELRGLRDSKVCNIRAVGRRYALILRNECPRTVLRFVQDLLKSKDWAARVIALETVRDHPGAFQCLNDSLLRAWAKGLSDWGSTDLFGITIAGSAWREGLISDDVVLGWAHSRDRWQRRLALVATVPLNAKSRGGTGDAKRTLSVCLILVDDRDDMVVKAMSWALRELAKRDAQVVRSFLRRYENRVAALVRREAHYKLTTGRKTKP